MATKTFDMWQAYQAGPTMWGSVQDITPLAFIYQGQPFIMTDEPGLRNGYIHDSLGRLIVETTLPQGSSTNYGYDNAGNRVSVVSNAGMGGL
jgi:YD repeat-containing protein